MKLVFEIQEGDFANAGKASSKIKKLLKQLNVDAKKIKQIVVAIYEAEVNVVSHSFGGKMIAVISENKIQVQFSDRGPGIKNVNQAMQAGFSTASKKVREMGFGAGMGLPNIKKNTDEFSVKSTPGMGTVVEFTNYF